MRHFLEKNNRRLVILKIIVAIMFCIKRRRDLDECLVTYMRKSASEIGLEFFPFHLLFNENIHSKA